MAKKNKDLVKSVSLFDDEDVKIEKKTSKKDTKTNDTDNNCRKSKSSNKLQSNTDNKKDSKEKSRNIKQDSAKSTRTTDNKSGKSVKGKQSDVKKSDDRPARKSRAKSKSSNEPTKLTKKSKRGSTKENNVQITEQFVEKETEKKVGPRRWKYGFHKGCEDRMVWLEEVGHWVYKSAFHQTDPKRPKYEYSNYIQGLDSYYIMFLYKPKTKSKGEK